MNSLLTELGIEVPANVSEEDLVRKIIHDNAFWNRCIDFLVLRVSTEVAQTLPFLERQALAKKFSVQQKVAATVLWGFTPPDRTIGGKMFITATCGSETAHWSGHYSKIHEFVFHGQHIPGDLQYLYKTYSNVGVPDPDGEQQRRERIQYEHEAQNKRLLPEEVMVKEQFPDSQW